ncbi:MAG TPA: YhcH/YjgK/YiaL family protein [Chryseosolibacter sp.]|nr:YhcH/YjgK/YiaL family protein [Chryseosolibacter sp.]
MIVGNIRDLKRYGPVIPQAKEVLDFLQHKQIPAVGEWMMLPGGAKVIRLQDWNRSHLLFEAHRQYYDLHLTLKGIDRIYFCFGAEDRNVNSPYDEARDYILFECREEASVTLKEGWWAFINPEEPHRNEFASPGTEKLVFKIPVE